MAISPWYKGDLYPAWVISLVPDTGTFNTTGLTASNFSLIIRNNDPLTPTEITGTGTFTGLTAATSTTPATIQYQPASADVSTIGNFTVLVQCTFPSGGIQTFNLGSWQVQGK